METQKLRVIIVEDEGLIARDMASMLDQLGYEVAGMAATGAEALRLACSVPADLVLMDIKIRGTKDGIETALEIRDQVGLPVVFLTSHADSDTIRRAKQTEPFGYIVKPFNETDLKVALEIGFNRHTLQQQAEDRQLWLDTALSSISGAVIAVDGDGRIQFFNTGAESLTGWTSRSACQRAFQEVLQLRDEKGQSQNIDLDSIMTSDQPLSLGRSVCYHKTGSASVVTGSLGPMRRKDSGLLYGAVINLQTIPEPPFDRPVWMSSSVVGQLSWLT